MQLEHIVDQRDIQRRGGRCAKYPTSCLIHDMLERLLRKQGLRPEDLVVLDTTYGEGRFYGAWRPYRLIACDIRRWEWVVRPDVFVRAPSWSCWRKLGLESVDLVVVDPPWMEKPGNGTREPYMLRYAFGSPETIILGAITTAEMLQAKHVLVHYTRYILRPGWRIAGAVKYVYVSRYLKNQDLDSSPNHTLFYILEKVMG